MAKKDVKPDWGTKDQALLERLRAIRTRKDLKLPYLPKILRTEVPDLSGDLQPFNFRYYQIQGILSMVSLKRMVLGDGTGLGKTIETIGTLSYLWDKNPNMKVVVVAPKSAIGQWGDEVQRFTYGVKVFTATAPKKAKDVAAVEIRRSVYEAWKAHEGPAVLVMNYAILIRDWNYGAYQPLLSNGDPDPKHPVQPGMLNLIMQSVGPQLTAIFDEATAFKSRATKTWETVAFLCRQTNRAYALTATLLKNRLIEGFHIYGALMPGVFTTQKAFFDDYCYVELKKVGKARIPIIKGYKNLDGFRERIELVYLGRPKHEVSDELPTLSTREVTFELDEIEIAKYREATTGLLSLGDGSVREFEKTKLLTSLIYCQQVVNSLALLKFKEGAFIDTSWDDMEGQKVKELSSKEQALVDLLTEELDDDKVIVYTRFASHVPRLQAILKKHRIESVAITGAQKDPERKAAQKAFQDLKSKTKVIFITAAGSEAINLQAAAGLVFFDMPWSWGDYVQILGRMIRIGSPHKGVLCFHLLAKLPGRGQDAQTIDHYVLTRLRKKKGLIDKVLGEAAVGALKFEKDSEDAVGDLIKAIRRNARA